MKNANLIINGVSSLVVSNSIYSSSEYSNLSSGIISGSTYSNSVYAANITATKTLNINGNLIVGGNTTLNGNLDVLQNAYVSDLMQASILNAGSATLGSANIASAYALPTSGGSNGAPIISNGDGTTRFFNGANIFQFGNNLLTTNGYQYFPGGLKVAWGVLNWTSLNSISVTGHGYYGTTAPKGDVINFPPSLFSAPPFIMTGSGMTDPDASGIAHSHSGVSCHFFNMTATGFHQYVAMVDNSDDPTNMYPFSTSWLAAGY
jgi:hypothetical protein